MPALPDQGKLGLTERLGYAGGDLASCLYYNTFSLFLMFFYTDTFGIGPAAAGTMLLVTRTWDTFADPVMGMIADRTRSRFGKFRPWLLWMAAPFLAAGVLTFTTPSLGPAGKLVYAYVSYSLVMLVYTAINVPYGALLGVITPNTQERTRLSSYRFLGAFIGNLVVQGTLLYLVAHLGGGNDRVGFPLAMAIYGTLAMCLFLFTFASTRERVPALAGGQSTVRDDLRGLLRNRPWLVLGGVSILSLIWISIRGASIVYYFKYYVGRADLTASFLVSGTVFTLAGVAATAWLTRLLGGKRYAYMWLSLINAATLVALFFAGPDDLVLIYATQILGSFFTGPLMPLVWAMYADTADYGEWKFGRRATGLIFSAGTFSQKMGWTVGGAIAGWLLALYGFKANVTQTPEALLGIRLMMTVLPAAASVITTVVAVFYKIDRRLEKQIETELANRRRAAVAQGEVA